MRYKTKKSNLIFSVILFVIAAAFMAYGIYIIRYSIGYIRSYMQISTISFDNAFQYVVTASINYIGFAILMAAAGIIIFSLRKPHLPVKGRSAQYYESFDDEYADEDGEYLSDEDAQLPTDDTDSGEVPSGSTEDDIAKRARQKLGIYDDEETARSYGGISGAADDGNTDDAETDDDENTDGSEAQAADDGSEQADGEDEGESAITADEAPDDISDSDEAAVNEAEADENDDIPETEGDDKADDEADEGTGETDEEAEDIEADNGDKGSGIFSRFRSRRKSKANDGSYDDAEDEPTNDKPNTKPVKIEKMEPSGMLTVNAPIHSPISEDQTAQDKAANTYEPPKDRRVQSNIPRSQIKPIIPPQINRTHAQPPRVPEAPKTVLKPDDDGNDALNAVNSNIPSSVIKNIFESKDE